MLLVGVVVFLVLIVVALVKVVNIVDVIVGKENIRVWFHSLHCQLCFWKFVNPPGYQHWIPLAWAHMELTIP